MKQDEKPKEKRFDIRLKGYLLEKLMEKTERTGMADRQALLDLIDKGIKYEEAELHICVK